MSTTKDARHPVSEDAVFARLARVLMREDGLMLRRCRTNSEWFGELGRFYAVNQNNHIALCHMDLEQAARDAGVLHTGERLAG